MQLLDASLKGCKQFLRLMGIGTFLPLGLMFFGCLSRLYYLGQHYLVVVVEAYNMCYEQAKIPVGFARLKPFPRSFKVPVFKTRPG